jgi:hypothetical protein
MILVRVDGPAGLEVSGRRIERHPTTPPIDRTPRAVADRGCSGRGWHYWFSISSIPILSSKRAVTLTLGAACLAAVGPSRRSWTVAAAVGQQHRRFGRRPASLNAGPDSDRYRVPGSAGVRSLVELRTARRHCTWRLGHHQPWAGPRGLGVNGWDGSAPVG